MTQLFYDAEVVAERIWTDYFNHLVTIPQPTGRGHFCPCPYAMPIKQLATDYLGLKVYRAPIGGDVLGVTTYCDSKLWLNREGEDVEVCLPKGTILLDVSLYGAHNHNRRRFTLAHEVAHQVIYRFYGSESEMHFRKEHPPRTPHDIQRTSSWCEMDANRLAASLLMPERRVRRCFRELFKINRLAVYGSDSMTPQDMRGFRVLYRQFDVSSKAMLIRLKGLGLLDERSYAEYEKLYPPKPRPYDMFPIPYPPFYMSRIEIEQGNEFYISKEGVPVAYGTEAPLEPTEENGFTGYRLLDWGFCHEAF